MVVPFEVSYQVVGPGYFETVGIPLLQGRPFLPTDRRAGVSVAIVNRSLAARLWPGGNGVGRRVILGGIEAEVVGVAVDSKVRDLRETSGPVPAPVPAGPRLLANAVTSRSRWR